MSNVIRLQKPSRDAFNPDRPLEKNQLIAAQVKHFKEAEERLPPQLQSGIDIATIKTEGQASQYIRKVTEALHKKAGRPAQDVRTAR